MIGKKLKNNVSLDIVDFGEEDDGKPEKLEALLSAVNNDDSSHLIHVPPCPDALSDVLIRHNIVLAPANFTCSTMQIWSSVFCSCWLW